MIGFGKVLRDDRVAIGPLCVMPEMKRLILFVGRNVPALGYTGDGMQIVRIFGNETLQERGNDVERADTVYDLRIEILDFLAVALVQNLEPVPSFDVGFGAMTREEQTRAERENAGERMRPRVLAPAPLPWRAVCK
jgi:hypothetical protein